MRLSFGRMKERGPVLIFIDPFQRKSCPGVNHCSEKKECAEVDKVCQCQTVFRQRRFFRYKNLQILIILRSVATQFGQFYNCFANYRQNGRTGRQYVRQLVKEKDSCANNSSTIMENAVFKILELAGSKHERCARGRSVPSSSYKRLFTDHTADCSAGQRFAIRYPFQDWNEC